MDHLFSSLSISGIHLKNRIVMAPLVTSYASDDGTINDKLYEYYVRRAHGGVGLIVTEPARVLPPLRGTKYAHIGLYSNEFIPRLRRLSASVHGGGARLMLSLEAPAELAYSSIPSLQALVPYFIQAARRAIAARCDGVMLSSSDGGVLHALLSPLLNRRQDEYGLTNTGRLRLTLEIIEGIRKFLGPRLLLGFRLLAEEFDVEGINLQDARVIAKRLVSAGVNLLDVNVDKQTEAPLARFPGWCIPLANSIKRFVPEVAVIGSGQLDDPLLADSVIREGSVDLVMVEQSLQQNPYWPHIAHILLLSHSNSPSETLASPAPLLDIFP